MTTIRSPAAAPGQPAKATRVASSTRPSEVVVVTEDAELERSLREAAPATPLSVATTPAALADRLMTGRVGALVLDIGALDSAAVSVARHLAEQFPDVPLVAVGSREDEARVAGLISAGLVYRFLHRPVSIARARTFVDAALRRAAELRPQSRPELPRAGGAASARSGYRPGLGLAIAAAAATLGVGVWLARRPPAAPPPRAAVTVAVAVAADAVPANAVPAPSVPTRAVAAPLTPAVPPEALPPLPATQPAAAVTGRELREPAAAADAAPPEVAPDPVAGASPAAATADAEPPVTPDPTARAESAAGAATPAAADAAQPAAVDGGTTPPPDRP